MAGEPIFVGGLSFSGKTPLRLMLSSHPNIAMSRRTYMWPRYYRQYGDLGRPENFERCLSAMLSYKHTRALHPDPERIRREFWQGEPTYARLFALFQEHYAERLGKSRWGDQLGFIERYVDPIFAAYPTAKMIHLIRDPCDRYEASLASVPHRRGKVGWDTARWLHSVRLAKRNQQRYPDRYKIVCYEALVTRPEGILREICAFLGEDFVPAMLTMEDAIRFGGAEDREPRDVPGDLISTTAVGQSPRRLMSAGEVAFAQTQARREMLAYGYPIKQVRFSLRDRLRCYAVDWPANLAGMVAWRTLEATPFARH